MYKINDISFNTFEELVQWVWNTHKIAFEPTTVIADMTEEQKQLACREAQAHINGEEIMGF